MAKKRKKRKKANNRKRLTLSKSKSKAKAKQASKIAEIRDELVTLGYDSTSKQAIALRLNRSTAWAALNRDTKAGPSATIIRRILHSPYLPPTVRRKIEEYIDEKSAGLYGHSPARTRSFRAHFREPTSKPHK